MGMGIGPEPDLYSLSIRLSVPWDTRHEFVPTSLYPLDPRVGDVFEFVHCTDHWQRKFRQVAFNLPLGHTHRSHVTRQLQLQPHQTQRLAKSDPKGYRCNSGLNFLYIIKDPAATAAAISCGLDNKVSGERNVLIFTFFFSSFVSPP
jgi:hypothetical protein